MSLLNHWGTGTRGGGAIAGGPGAAGGVASGEASEEAAAGACSIMRK